MVEIERILTNDEPMTIDLPEGLSSNRLVITMNRISLSQVKVTIAEVNENLKTLPPPDYNTSLTREEARRRLAAAGKLAKVEPLTTEEETMDRDWTPLVLPLGSPGSEVLVDEDRGER